LATVSTSAFAKGVEILVIPTIAGGVTIGIIGGLVSAGRGLRAGRGLKLSLAALLLLATAFIAYELVIEGRLGGVPVLLFWVYAIAAICGVVPLIVGFAASYFVAKLIRTQVTRRGTGSDTAP
jgi:hypothetical protein